MIRFTDVNSEIMYRFSHVGQIYLIRSESISCILKSCKEEKLMERSIVT